MTHDDSHDSASPSNENVRQQDGTPKTKRDLAEDRTEWAHRRTLLAKERTFAGWVRTGLAAIAVGFGAAQLLVDLEPRWLVLSASMALVVLGASAIGMGFWSYRETLRRLEREGVRGMPMWLIGTFTVLLVLTAIAGMALIVLNG